MLFRRNKSMQFALGAILSAVLLVTGCGTSQNTTSGAPATDKPATQTTTPAPTTDTKTEVRKVKHAMGETEMKGTPERVVILTSEGTEALLAMGVKPVGAVKGGMGNPWHDHIKDKMEGVTELGEERQPNIELIASLQPDLIIGNKTRQEKVYAQLSSIAPTVFSEDIVGDWKINFKLYAEALNKQSEGDKIMADFDKKVADAKVKLGDKTKNKVSLARFLPGKVRLYMKDTFAGVLLQELGIARPAAQDKDEFMQVIQKEQMADMDGDVLFFWVSDYEADKAAAKFKDEWMNDPLYKNLNVAKNNKAFEVNEVIWNVGGGILSAELLLEDIVKRFETW